jgi:hypothetical protein
MTPFVQRNGKKRTILVNNFSAAVSHIPWLRFTLLISRREAIQPSSFRNLQRRSFAMISRRARYIQSQCPDTRNQRS